MALPGTGSRTLARFTVQTPRRNALVEVTREVTAAIAKISKGGGGAAVVYIPHTTAGVIVQENADPDVQHDLLAKLEELVPHREPYYQHAEGNSDSHLKSVMTGTAVTLIVDAGRPILGRWQGVYLAEFDGPRERDVIVKFLSDGERELD